MKIFSGAKLPWTHFALRCMKFNTSNRSKNISLISRFVGILSLTTSILLLSARQASENSIGSVEKTMNLSSSPGYSSKLKTDGCLSFTKVAGSLFKKVKHYSFILSAGWPDSTEASDFFLSQTFFSKINMQAWSSFVVLLAW